MAQIPQIASMNGGHRRGAGARMYFHPNLRPLEGLGHMTGNLDKMMEAGTALNAVLGVGRWGTNRCTIAWRGPGFRLTPNP